MLSQRTVNRSQKHLLVGLCLLVFFNISCFTIITSFTKGNFLTAVQTSPLFDQVTNQKPYFILYGLSGMCFILFYLLYHLLSPQATFERRIKRDILALIGCSVALYLIPFFMPGFERRFLPATVYFIVYDILDDLIIVQTWTLINYSINIRESKKVQNLFLFSGGVAAFISGRFVVGLIPQHKQGLFFMLVILLSVISYLIVTYIFSVHRSRILATISAEKVSLKTLFASQKKYTVIKSIIYITILIGVFNLFFKVLFDTQVNVRYPVQTTSQLSPLSAGEAAQASGAPDLLKTPDPKTQFIGKYKAFISLFQVALQLLFIYFFARLWLNGRILFSYPLLLIPNLLFLLWAYFARWQGHEGLLFWGTVVACGVNELIRRVVFDSAYQLLMFSIPERMCNALRMYSRLFIKPVVIICICIFFILLPIQKDPMPLYCVLLILFLVLMILVVKRIPGDYVASLKRSVLRRVPIERAYDSLVSLEANFIVDQYRKVVAESDDRFGYLYILNIVRNSYSSELDFILARLVDNEDREVRRETVTVVGDLGLVKLSEDLERLFERETDPSVRKACLKVTAQWGPSSGAVVRRWMALALPADLRKHVLAIAFRSDRKGLEVAITREVMERLESQEAEDILSGIWLVGELELTDLKERIRGHFGIEDPRAFDIITGAISKLLDFDLFTDYLTHIGYEHIRNYETLNRNLAMFGSQSFRIISDMIAAIIGSRSYSELEKCLHTLQFIPSQESLDFLGDILFRHDVPVVRKEALNCVAKIKKENPDLDYSVFLEKLPSEIKRCKEYCRYYRVIRTWNRDSILLIELARNIEHRVWIIFKIMDMFNPDLAVFDSYYRITQISRHQIGESHVKAKSIEYLESLIKTEHTEFLSLLDAIVFEDGFFSDVGLSPDPSLDVVGVYEHIMLRSYYWLQVSAILDMPEPVKERYGSIAKETENMIPVLEKIHFLRRVSLFKGFSVMEMIIIAQITQDVKFDTDHVLFKAGDPGDALYIILEGRVHILNEKGGLLNELEPPQCFGEIAVLDKGGRAATAVCVEDCRMLVISSNDFQEILERYPILYKNIVFILTGWLRENRS